MDGCLLLFIGQLLQPFRFERLLVLLEGGEDLLFGLGEGVGQARLPAGLLVRELIDAWKVLGPTVLYNIYVYASC